MITINELKEIILSNTFQNLSNKLKENVYKPLGELYTDEMPCLQGLNLSKDEFNDMGINKEKLVKGINTLNSHFINYYFECVKDFTEHRTEYNNNNDHFYQGYEKDNDSEEITELPYDSIHILEQVAEFYLFENEIDNYIEYLKKCMSNKKAKEYICELKVIYEKTKTNAQQGINENSEDSA